MFNNFTQADIEQRLRTTRDQLAALRSQHDQLADAVARDPYETRFRHPLEQAKYRIGVLQEQEASLQRSLHSFRPVDQQRDMISSGQVWVSHSDGDSRTRR